MNKGFLCLPGLLFWLLSNPTFSSTDPTCTDAEATLASRTISSGEDFNCIATLSMQAGPGFTISTSASANLQTPTIDLKASIHVAQGVLSVDAPRAQVALYMS